MRKRILLVAAFVFTLLSTLHAEKVRVVTRDLEPFSFMDGDRRTGFAMDLWDRVAREAGLEYDVRVVGTAQDMIDALANKQADVAVGALSVTAKREAIVDFSQPFYESGLQILTAGGSSSPLQTAWSLVSGFFNLKLIGAFVLLVVVMFLISHLVWVYEHKVNPEMWPEHYRHGLWESFWWTVSTLLVGGADNKGPIGVGGRVVAIIWMLLSIVLVALLTASFTATLTVNSLKGDIKGPDDLAGREVATIRGSTAESWLTAHNVKARPYAQVSDCIEAVKKGSVAAVVYDAPMLQYAVAKSGDGDLQLIEPVFDRQNYALGLQQDSSIRERINQALLALSESGVNARLRDDWFKTAPAQ